MTTAGRPTFDTARGGSGRGEKSLSALSKQYSARDLPGHTKLKYRQSGQGTSDELKDRDYRRELEERERSIASSKHSQASGSRASSAVSGVNKRSRLEPLPSAPPDDEDEDLGTRDSSDEDDSEDEDDTAELLAELERIKKERATEEAKKETEKKAQEEKIRMENILSGNPLLTGKASTATDFKVKRRWDDDVVFKNCARGEPDKSKPQFINDTLRSEFHKKFMDKYIK